MENVGQNIREARRRAGLRTEALAGRIGYSASAIETYERGKIIPKLDVIEAPRRRAERYAVGALRLGRAEAETGAESRICRCANSFQSSRTRRMPSSWILPCNFAGNDRAATLIGGETMPKEKVNRTPDYKLRVRIRGEIDAQGVPISKACEYAGVSVRTFYRLLKEPMRYFPETLELMRNLSIPIEDVRGMIQYPW